MNNPTPKDIRELFLFILLPSVMLTFALVSYLFLVESEPKGELKNALAYWAGGVTVMLVLSALNAPFQRSIAEPLALLNILLCGTLALSIFAVIYHQHGLVDNGVCTEKNLQDTLYFSIVTFTTLGYGDFQPCKELRLLAGLEALFGYVFLGFSVAIANDAMVKRSSPQDSVWTIAKVLGYPKRVVLRACAAFWSSAKTAGSKAQKRLRKLLQRWQR